MNIRTQLDAIRTAVTSGDREAAEDLRHELYVWALEEIRDMGAEDTQDARAMARLALQAEEMGI